MKKLLILLLFCLCINNVFAEKVCFKGGEWLYRDGEVEPWGVEPGREWLYRDGEVEPWSIEPIYGECDNPSPKSPELEPTNN